MRWSLVLICVLLLLAVSEGRKKKPSKGKKPGKKPSKPGVKGECDVGSPKLPQETPRSTLTKENVLAGGISPGTTVLAVRRELAPCSAGSQCTSSATRSLTWAALVSATTSSLSQEKATPASLTTPTRTVPGATRTGGNASRMQSLALTQRREAAVK